jgi:uncharacterized membrane protein YdfJ with MMPL/SSD domain
MFDARRLAAIPAGRRTKWVVLLAWVAIAALAFPLGGRLTGVQRNDVSSYLPRNAESTRVNRQLAGFPDSGSLAAVVVYRRETGLTAADRARAAADRELLARRYPAARAAPAPVRSPNGKALVTSIPLPASDASDAETRKLLAYLVVNSVSQGILTVLVFGFVFLVALGIDYNIFPMTRVREESQRAGTRAGTLRGLAVTGGVITSAGIVLAATFAVLGVLPLVLLTQIGFVVAFGVLLDTLIVRSVLVPALAFDLDRRIWWPSRLAATRPPAPVGGPLPDASG